MCVCVSHICYTQLSTVYESMKISEFMKLVSFMTLHEAEKYLLEIVKRKIVIIRIDHQNGALHFGMWVCVRACVGVGVCGCCVFLCLVCH